MFRQFQHILALRTTFQLSQAFCKAVQRRTGSRLPQVIPLKKLNLVQKEKEQELVPIENESFEITLPVEKDYAMLTERLMVTTDKQKLSRFQISDLIEINKYICKSNDLALRESVWQKLEVLYKKRMERAEIHEIAEILWLYAYSNRKDPKFFKVIEDNFLSRDFAIDVDAKIIKKILWGFSQANFGSTVLYSQISTHIKRIYHEIHPIMLAEYSNYFSKSSASLKGGFGVYQIAEEMLMHRLGGFDIIEVKRICEYLLPQNIGSNDFYKAIEERVLKLYKDDMEPSTLVSLCKSMSTFRFQTNLGTKMEKNLREYVEYLSNSQLEDILWAYSRGNKGSDELYTKLEAEFIKRMNLLKPRGVAFSFYGFAKMNKTSFELVQKYEEYIMKNIDQFNLHYLTKVLIALSQSNPMHYSQDLVTTIFDKIKYFEGSVPGHEVLRMLDAMQGLTATLKNLSWDDLYVKMQDIIRSIKKLGAQEASMMLFHFISSNQGTESFVELLKKRIGHVNQIPKKTFAEGLFGYVEMSDLDNAYDFIPIVDELCAYGNIKYFFDHSNFIRLLWSLATLVHIDPAVVIEMQKFSQQNVKEALMDIEVNSLRQDVLRLYFQTWALFKSLGALEEAEEERLYQKFAELNTYQQTDLIENDPTMLGNPEIKGDVYRLATDFIEEKKLKMTSIKEMKDEYYNIIDVALINEQTLDKIAILVFNKNHYLKCSDWKTKKQQIQNKIAFLEAFEWEVVEVEEEQWSAMNNDQKQSFMEKELQAALNKEKSKAKENKKKSRRQRKKELDFDETEDKTA